MMYKAVINCINTDIGRYTKAAEQSAKQLIRLAAREWLVAAVRRIPIRTGFLRGAFTPLEQLVGHVQFDSEGKARIGKSPNAALSKVKQAKSLREKLEHLQDRKEELERALRREHTEKPRKGKPFTELTDKKRELAHAHHKALEQLRKVQREARARIFDRHAEGNKLQDLLKQYRELKSQVRSKEGKAAYKEVYKDMHYAAHTMKHELHSIELKPSEANPKRNVLSYKISERAGSRLIKVDEAINRVKNKISKLRLRESKYNTLKELGTLSQRLRKSGRTAGDYNFVRGVHLNKKFLRQKVVLTAEGKVELERRFAITPKRTAKEMLAAQRSGKLGTVQKRVNLPILDKCIRKIGKRLMKRKHNI
jgi:hypothetical protein